MVDNYRTPKMIRLWENKNFKLVRYWPNADKQLELNALAPVLFQTGRTK
jgi:hypothetical protein